MTSSLSILSLFQFDDLWFVVLIVNVGTVKTRGDKERQSQFQYGNQFKHIGYTLLHNEFLTSTIFTFSFEFFNEILDKLIFPSESVVPTRNQLDRIS